MKRLSKSASALAGYLRPFFEKNDPASPLGRVISDWCWDNQTLFDVDLSELLATRGKGGIRRRRRVHGKALPKTAWRKLGEFMETCAQKPVASSIILNARMTSEVVGLDDIDTEIFVFIAMTTGERAFTRLISKVLSTRVLETVDIISEMTGIDAANVAERLNNGLLNRLQFIDGVEDRPGIYDLYVPYTVMDAVRSSTGSIDGIERALLGNAARSKLNWSDFDHIARERDFAVQIVRSAIRCQERGVNILLYGAPGVGKTEFAKTLAHRAGCDLFPIAEYDEDGEEPDREERLSSLRIADRLARRRGACVLLFDEMEDVLSGGDISWRKNRRIRQSGSKVHLNRLLEHNESPVIWTTNSVHEFDPAFLRRMTFSIEMKIPPASVRARQWRRLAKKSGVKLSHRRSNELARAHALPPSFANSALRAVAAAGDESDLEFALNAVARPGGSNRMKQPRIKVRSFDLALINPDCDLSLIERRLQQATCPHDVSFCLYGPPGTGKSALAAHLADCLELDILEKRGSDLLSPWVGETEQNIAEAFEEAALEQKLLIIDEAETLFWNRDGATKSWEASMVNEFLVGLERSPVPVVCTTNHLERIDAAALRRFTFKAKLDYLTGDQAAAAFSRFFSQAAPASIKRCGTLTPGDFAVVQKQLRFCEEGKSSPMKIASMLETEAAVKQKGISRIGF
ncbi:hypothetical protein MNBD_ALPHA05-802 [hydrothermal vent metagenome]|uniref:AAA+ ATPase domain-containing protein n=1 Tax=hydrothermal vent metagenome TaxID=652676 RepID=A0A3B0T237_9ZZZZ